MFFFLLPNHKPKDYWAGKTWILHHDNAPAHTALSVKQFLVSKKITTLDHPPDLAPCNFFLFPKLKGILKGTRFEEVDDFMANVMAFLKSIKKNGIYIVLQGVVKKNGKVRQSHWRIGYFEGDN